MARIGGNFFQGVQFPVAFGDRFIAVGNDAVSGALLIDVYRWDRELDRLVVELFQGRPLRGAPPITVEPLGGAGAIRLSTAAGAVVGYLAGGDDPRSIVISRDRITVVRGDEPTFEMISSTMTGFPIGVRVDDSGGIAVGAGIPRGFPEKRLFRDAVVVLTDLVGLSPVIAKTDFRHCRLVGPAIVASLGPLSIRNSTLPPPEQFVWELPVASGEVAGAIGLIDCDIDGCSFEGVALAVAPGTRDETISHLLGS